MAQETGVSLYFDHAASLSLRSCDVTLEAVGFGALCIDRVHSGVEGADWGIPVSQVDGDDLFSSGQPAPHQLSSRHVILEIGSG